MSEDYYNGDRAVFLYVGRKRCTDKWKYQKELCQTAWMYACSVQFFADISGSSNKWLSSLVDAEKKDCEGSEMALSSL